MIEALESFSGIGIRAEIAGGKVPVVVEPRSHTYPSYRTNPGVMSRRAPWVIPEKTIVYYEVFVGGKLVYSHREYERALRRAFREAKREGDPRGR